ncbi:MAG: hypothetical protein ACRCX2_36070 [Paraclostridium sp.]
MATRLGEVYRLFLSDIEDEEWLLVEDEVVEDLLLTYLEKATVDFDVCRKDLSINYNDLTFNEQLDLNERVILSKGMLLHYLSPKIVREENMRQFVTSKDFSKLSNANMLDKLLKLKKYTQDELDIYLSKYDYKVFEGLN